MAMKDGLEREACEGSEESSGSLGRFGVWRCGAWDIIRFKCHVFDVDVSTFGDIN